MFDMSEDEYYGRKRIDNFYGRIYTQPLETESFKIKKCSVCGSETWTTVEGIEYEKNKETKCLVQMEV